MKKIIKRTLFALLFALPVILNAQRVQEKKLHFSDKVTHSVSLQYNIGIYPKNKFVYYCNPADGYISLPAVGREYRLTYGLNFRSGFGLSIGAASGLYGFRNRNAETNFGSAVNMPLSYFIPLFDNYLNVSLNATYSRQLSQKIFIQPNIGITMPFYFQERFCIHESYLSDMGEWVLSKYLSVDNTDCHRMFIPDLTLGVNFLFHTKSNPRSNFVLGVNANIGFVPRYTGYFSLREPFTEEVKDCDITCRDTYFGFNFGYQFISLPKTFNRKQYRKELEYSTFDFKIPVHSIALIFDNGFGVFDKLSNASGPIKPRGGNRYKPELVLKYSIAIKNGVGLAVEIPFGYYYRTFITDLFGVVPPDTVWASGIVGDHNSLDGFGYADVYYGLSLKASYLAPIHRNVLIQPELGLKFAPFLGGFDRDFEDEYYSAIWDDEYERGVAYMRYTPKLNKRSFYIPDLSFAVNFIVHGKNPNHNFIFGINSTFSFVDRLTIDYGPLPPSSFPERYASSGTYHYKMGSIGLHIGYQFMTGKKVKFDK